MKAKDLIIFLKDYPDQDVLVLIPLLTPVADGIVESSTYVAIGFGTTGDQVVIAVRPISERN